MSDIPCYVLTCAPGSRLGEVVALFEMLKTPYDKRVTVTTYPDPITDDTNTQLVTFESDELNISKWWTAGLDWIAWAAGLDGHEQYDVFVVESDVRITSTEFAKLRTALREINVAMVGADWHNTLAPGIYAEVHRKNIVPRPTRLPGVALLVKGELGIRHDPQFRWWFVDDDYELAHRANGGTALIAGVHMEHDGTTPLVGDRKRFVEEDHEKFLKKWETGYYYGP